jgi:hypothetical protein
VDNDLPQIGSLVERAKLRPIEMSEPVPRLDTLTLARIAANRTGSAGFGNLLAGVSRVFPKLFSHLVVLTAKVRDSPARLIRQQRVYCV